MNAEDLERFIVNRSWFNEFFLGLRQPFDRVSTMLSKEFSLPSQGSYYSKPNFYPSIPPYYVRGLGGDQIAIQILAVFDITMLRHPFFKPEPSLVVIKHGDAEKYPVLTEYAERIVGDGPIADEEESDSTLSGLLRGHIPSKRSKLALITSLGVKTSTSHSRR